MSARSKDNPSDQDATLQRETPSPPEANVCELNTPYLLDHIRDGYALFEELRERNSQIADYKIHEINSVAARIIGLPRDRLLNLRISEVVGNGPDAELFGEELVSTIAAAQEQQEHEKYFTEISRWLAWTTHRVSRKSIYILFRDTTEYHNTRDELVKIQHLDSLGNLAGGIAHEFNNLFQGIVGHISVARTLLENPELAGASLEKALAVAERAKKLSNQLLTFAKGGSPNKQHCCIEQMVKEVLELSLLDQKVEGIIEISAGLWTCEADKNQVRQALGNVVLNAAEAKPANGIVRVCAKNTHLNNYNSMQLAPGPYLKITVSDSGIGIPSAIQRSIFDPFFTNKLGKRGLGLTSAFSIITKHGGFISVDSEHLVGTTVTVYLPAIEQQVYADEATPGQLDSTEVGPTEVGPTEVGGGRILLMDDEEYIRETLSLMLAARGFESTSVSNGREAIEVYRRSMSEGKKFDAVILDLTMRSGIGGREVIQSLRQLDPDVRAIVSSGYSSDRVMSNPEGYGFCAILPKPYGIKELTRALALTISKNQREEEPN